MGHATWRYNVVERFFMYMYIKHAIDPHIIQKHTYIAYTCMCWNTTQYRVCGQCETCRALTLNMSATPRLVGSEQVEGQQESSLSVEQVALLGREPPVSRRRRSHTLKRERERERERERRKSRSKED